MLVVAVNECLDEKKCISIATPLKAWIKGIDELALAKSIQLTFCFLSKILCDSPPLRLKIGVTS